MYKEMSKLLLNLLNTINKTYKTNSLTEKDIENKIVDIYFLNNDKRSVRIRIDFINYDNLKELCKIATSIDIDNGYYQKEFNYNGLVIYFNFMKYLIY